MIPQIMLLIEKRPYQIYITYIKRTRRVSEMNCSTKRQYLFTGIDFSGAVF